MIKKRIITEKERESKRKWAKNNPDKIKKYREKNCDRLREYQRKWRAKNKDRIKELHKQWRNKNPEEWRATTRKGGRKYRATLKGYYLSTKNAAANRGVVKVMFSFKEFEEWHSLQKQQCSYCDISQEVMVELGYPWKFKIQNRLSLDRLDSDKDYVLDNICLACRVCNVVKNSILSAKEMREVSQKYIKPQWQKQLKLTK